MLIVSESVLPSVLWCAEKSHTFSMDTNLAYLRISGDFLRLKIKNCFIGAVI